MSRIDKVLIGGVAIASLLAPLAARAQAMRPPLVAVGYADTLRPPFGDATTCQALETCPSPWQGSPKTVFVGSPPGWDAGAIKITQPSIIFPMEIVSMSVDFGPPAGSLSPWDFPVTIGAGVSAIFTQTKHYDFDTSDFGCVAGLPVVHLAIRYGGGALQRFKATDSERVLTAGGVDIAACRNEKHPWFNLTVVPE